MPLRWDPLLVRALASELDARLSGSRLRSVRLDGSSRELVLLFREATLAWPLHPTRGAPLLLPPGQPGAADLSLPARLRRVRAPEDERILLFELLPTRGGRHADLVVELLGNQWNAIVTEGPEARIRHVLVRREGPRPMRVGGTWVGPPAAGREGSDAPIPIERWHEILEPVPPPQRRRALVQHVAWTSPINAAALVDALGDPAESLQAGYGAWREMAFGERPPAPVLLHTGGSLQPYPWPLAGLEHEPADGLLEAFRLAAERERPGAAPAGAEATQPPELVAALERVLDGALRRATRLTAELEGLDDEASLRGRADLLLARFAQVPAGAEEVELAGFGGEPVRIPLDPTRSVQENAAALYDRASRVGRARERLPGLIGEARRTAEQLQSLLERTRQGDVTAEELRAALPASAEPVPGGAEPSALPYRRFRSSGGLEIRVGRGARSNDDLTFHHAAPDDVWLHARHAAGAHVILRWGKPGNPPARDLHEAAVLAALHSRARTSGSVPVDWTARKYVRKPRRAAPGAVVPQRVKTVFVEPDSALGERLAED